MTLEDLIRAGWSDERIGRRLLRSPEAINIIRKRRGIPSRTAATLNARKTAKLLGVRCAKTIARWIADGYLRWHQTTPRGGNRQWLIEEEDLLLFLEDERAWLFWQPERITDDRLRAWALELRRGSCYFTTGEVGQRFHVGHGTVQAWIERGLLPAVRWGNWRIHERDLDGFVPPCARSKAGGHVRRFMSEEDARLLRLRADGMGWTAIARSMDRSVSSVFGRYQRLAARQQQRAA